MIRRMRAHANFIEQTPLILIGIGMVACVSWQVASRYMFSAPSVITDEIGRFLLMWFALLAAAYVPRNRIKSKLLKQQREEQREEREQREGA